MRTQQHVEKSTLTRSGSGNDLGLSNMKPNAKSEAKPKLKPKPKTRKTTEIDLEVETVDLGTGATDLIETGIETDIETDIQTETDLGPSKKKRKTVTPETKSTGVDLFNSQQTLAIQEIVADTIAKLAPTLSQLAQPDATAGVTSGANPHQPPMIWPQLLTTTPQPAPNHQPPFQYWQAHSP